MADQINEICSLCFFWDRDKKPEHAKKAHGLCLCAVEYGNDDDAMIVQDASMYLAQLYTAEDHGCKQFRKK